MSAASPDCIPPDELKDSGRPILLPAGLPAARSMFAPLAEAAGLRLEEYAPPVASDWRAWLEAIAPQTPALLVAPTSLRIGPELLGELPGRFGGFASAATGTDHVDLAWLQARGFPYFGAPGVNADSVAQFVTGALPLLVPEARLLSGDVCIGILGHGRIGSRLAVYLERLDLNVRSLDPFLSDGAFRAGARVHSWEELVADADLVTLHVPLTLPQDDASGKRRAHATQGMLDFHAIAALPPGCALCNTARGSIFPGAEEYLSACKDRPTLMDVFPIEPPEARLVHAARYATPHVAGYNYEARAGAARRLALEFARWLGLDPALVPPLPEIDCPLDALGCVEIEDQLLKADAASFARRRSFYPARAGWRRLRDAGVRPQSAFAARILDTLADLADG